MNAAIRYSGIVAVAILISGGCGTQMAPVSGTVQRDGQIVPGGTVLFRPLGEGKPAVGPIQPDGTFQMRTESPGDGVMFGQYRVVVVGQRGAKDPSLRTSYVGPGDKPLEVVAGKRNEFVINISTEEGWQPVKGDDD